MKSAITLACTLMIMIGCPAPDDSPDDDDTTHHADDDSTTDDDDATGDDDDATGDDDTSADCPGGGGEMVCCDEGELLCGTTASAYGEDCCVSGEICEQCWSPDDEEYGGLCIPVGADCPYEAEPE